MRPEGEVAGGEGVHSSQGAQQQPVGRPRADAAKGEKTFGCFFVWEVTHGLQVKGAVNYGGGYVEDVFGLAVAQLDASEAGYAIGEEGRRGREGVVGVAIVGHG